jgi:hypothetical protein
VSFKCEGNGNCKWNIFIVHVFGNRINGSKVSSQTCDSRLISSSADHVSAFIYITHTHTHTHTVMPPYSRDHRPRIK